MKQYVSWPTVLQITTLLSVIIGIALVVYELRQARDLALADLLAQQFAYGGSFYGALVGDTAADTIAKSCIAPETLTPGDVAILNVYHAQQVDMIRMLLITSYTAGADVDELELESYAKDGLRRLFETKPGRAWWAANHSGLDGWLTDGGNEVFESLPSEPTCLRHYEEYLRKPAKAADGALPTAP